MSAGNGLLREVQARHSIVQDFCPLADSVGWQLGRLFYNERGSLAFRSSNESVPYEITSNGNLSRSAAEVLFAELTTRESNDKDIIVVELGAGSGLFARYFLDVFRELCSEANRDYYNRLSYVITDASNQMLLDMQRVGIFKAHAERVRFECFDVLADDVHSSSIAAINSIRAIFANYFLDSLPATVLRVHQDRLEDLRVRTRFRLQNALPNGAALTHEDVIRIVKTTDNDQWKNLVGHIPQFLNEYGYHEITTKELPFAEIVRELSRGSSPSSAMHVIYNYGAFQCIQRCCDLLCAGGFFLINDYGLLESMQPVPSHLHQQFGGATAIGLNFPLLKIFVEKICGGECVQPDSECKTLHARLIGRQISRPVKEAFGRLFSGQACEWTNEPLVRARQLVESGLHEEAVYHFCEAIDRQPHNWGLMAEVARFFTYGLKDAAMGAKIAHRGIELNPYTCADLWNTFGDAALCLGHDADAERAFLTATQIDPNNVRARYNQLRVLEARHDLEAALRTIADCFALDRSGEYEQLLLSKQAEVLRTLRQQHAEERRMMVDRSYNGSFL